MTIEELAATSQREYESIRNDMATREELKVTENSILTAIEHLGTQLSIYASRWNGEFDRLADNVHNLEIRIRAREFSRKVAVIWRVRGWDFDLNSR